MLSTRLDILYLRARRHKSDTFENVASLFLFDENIYVYLPFFRATWFCGDFQYNGMRRQLFWTSE